MARKKRDCEITAMVDKETSDFANDIKQSIEDGGFRISSWNAFIENAIWVFARLLSSGVEPKEFYKFVEKHEKTKIPDKRNEA